MGYFWAECTFHAILHTAINGRQQQSLNPEITADLEEVEAEIHCLSRQPSLSVIKYILICIYTYIYIYKY